MVEGPSLLVQIRIWMACKKGNHRDEVIKEWSRRKTHFDNSDVNELFSKDVNELFSHGSIGDIMDICCSSSKIRLLRVTALVLPAVRKLRRLVKTVEQPYLNAEALSEAENLRIKFVRATSFEDEIQQLSSWNKNTIQLINKLGLLMDTKGVIFCPGRLENKSCRTNKMSNPFNVESLTHRAYHWRKTSARPS